MNDRELLKWAAGAMGLTISYFHESGTAVVYRETYRDTCGAGGEYTNWNPLTDDGDALRLAVKLQLAVMPGNLATLVGRDDGPGPCASEKVTEWQDTYSATRRAIVRAAAEIGLQHK